MRSHKTHISFTGVFAIALVASSIMAQSGNRPNANTSGGVQVGVVARRDENSKAPITSKEVAIFDNGVEQSIRNFTPDPSPAQRATPRLSVTLRLWTHHPATRPAYRSRISAVTSRLRRFGVIFI